MPSDSDTIADLPLQQQWRHAATQPPASISPDVFRAHEQAALNTVREVANQLLQASQELDLAAHALKKHGHGPEANRAKTASLKAKDAAEGLLA